LLLAFSPARASADEDPPGAAPTNSISSTATATNDTLAVEARSQEMIRQAIEQIRREATQASRQLFEQAALSADMVSLKLDETLAARLRAIEQSIQEQHRRDIETLQNSNRTMLMIAGAFGVVGVLGILTAVAIIVRAMNRLSEVALALPAGLGHGPTPTLIDGDGVNTGQNRLDQASIRFLGAIERLEKRIQELELTAQPGHIDVEHHRQGSEIAAAATAALADSNAIASGNGAAMETSTAVDHKIAQAAILVGKGQALMNLGKLDEALICLDEATGLDPKNADALVKRGMVLEKLQKMEEALASYDRAIATNESLTLAYLYKGAVCNRLQRFREALECYEKALKTEQKPASS
jgi:tetratricopeptide (TPR) repeat protein